MVSFGLHRFFYTTSRYSTPVEDSLAPWADQIYQWLTGDRLTVTRIQELLRQCAGSDDYS